MVLAVRALLPEGRALDDAEGVTALASTSGSAGIRTTGA
jgi:hypothetical protein